MAPKATEVDISSCPVSGVVVYLDRADVTREIKVELEPGENEVIVKQLSRVIESDSVRVEGRGEATIGEVKYEERYVMRVKESSTDDTQMQTTGGHITTDELQREKERLKLSLDKLNALNNRISRQKQFVDQLASKVNSPDSPAQKSKKASVFSLEECVSEAGLEKVSAFMEFYDMRSREFAERLSSVGKELQEVRKQLQAVTANLSLRGVSSDKRVTREKERTVSIAVTCAKAGTVSLFLSYVVMDSGWTPQYDLRVFSHDQLLKIHYFAIISQSTGEDWNDAALVLSTAQPSIGGSPPELETQKLQFQRFYNTRATRYARNRGVRSKRYDGSSDEDFPEVARFRSLAAQLEETQNIMSCNIDRLVEKSEPLGGAEGFGAPPALGASAPPPPDLTMGTAEVCGTVTSTSFEIPRRTSIPADGTGHKVAVAIVDLNPSFEYETVPKMATHAFLKAQVKNSSPYALLEGVANVFLDNNFISKTSLSDVSPQEEFTCSLGVDPAVRVLYKPARRYTETTGFFSKSTLVTMRQTIELKNTRLDVAKIKVTDVLPISSDQSIQVSLLKPELSQKDTTTSVPCGTASLTKENHLEWQLDVPAASQHTIEFAYSVEYPESGPAVMGL